MFQTSPTPREERRGILFILTAAISWGTVGVTTQALYRLTATNPLSVGFFRLAIAAPLLAIACWLLLRRRMFQIAHRDFAIMILFGAMEALYQVCYFTAISLSGVAIATLVTLCTAPVMVALLSTIFIRERLTMTVGIALVCAICGTWLLVGARGAVPGGTSATLAGILFALASALGYALVILCARPLSRKYHSLQINSVGFTTGALLLLCFAITTHLYIAYPPVGWLLLGYVGTVPTALAYGLFVLGMRSTPATVASILTLLEPLTATLLAWLLFGERLGLLGLLGAGLLLGALLLLAVGQRVRK